MKNCKSFQCTNLLLWYWKKKHLPITVAEMTFCSNFYGNLRKVFLGKVEALLNWIFEAWLWRNADFNPNTSLKCSEHNAISFKSTKGLFWNVLSNLFFRNNWYLYQTYIWKWSLFMPWLRIRWVHFFLCVFSKNRIL